MKYYIIAGEKSGALHAGNLMKELLAKDPSAEFRYWGGDKMEEVAGHAPVHHYSELAMMGIIEVIRKYSTIKGYLKECENDILSWKPDVVILVDYGGFNMKVAKFCTKHDVKVFYYITPKAWAWNTGRANGIRDNVDRAFVILPFEKDFFAKFNFKEVDYVGNPVLDAVSNHEANDNFREENKLSDAPIIAVLPGSRKQEVEEMLEYMVRLMDQEKYKGYQFIVAGVDNLPKELYASIEGKKNGHLIFNQTYDLLENAEAAVVTSGTATLETALFKVPQVLCYRTNPISGYIFKKFMMKIDFIGLPNLIVDREIIRELFQEDYTFENLQQELDKLLFDRKERDKVLDGYEEMAEIMGKAGASKKTAELMVSYLKA